MHSGTTFGETLDIPKKRDSINMPADVASHFKNVLSLDEEIQNDAKKLRDKALKLLRSTDKRSRQ